MKILKTLTAVTALLITLGAAESAMAEMGKIYGPVYLSVGERSHHAKNTELTFSAPVPGRGVVVVNNGGDSGKKSRVSSAKVELNDETILEPRHFNRGHHGKLNKRGHKGHKRNYKKRDHKHAKSGHRHDRSREVKIGVDLLEENEIKVKIKSCRRCELEIYVMGELPPVVVEDEPDLPPPVGRP